MINNQINLTEAKIKKTEELLARLRGIMYRTDYDSLLAEDKELSNFILERNPEYFYMVFEKMIPYQKCQKRHLQILL